MSYYTIKDGEITRWRSGAEAWSSFHRKLDQEEFKAYCDARRMPLLDPESMWRFLNLDAKGEYCDLRNQGYDLPEEEKVTLDGRYRHY